MCVCDLSVVNDTVVCNVIKVCVKDAEFCDLWNSSMIDTHLSDLYDVPVKTDACVLCKDCLNDIISDT